jgi:hypothetical protein
VFEAFGQKFPIESASRWGVLIIIGIQFYFWLHLSEYRKRRFTLSTTAWIGSYASSAAQFLFVVTALIVPVGVITFVCLKAGLLPRGMFVRNILLCGFSVIVSAILSGLSGFAHLKSKAISQ